MTAFGVAATSLLTGVVPHADAATNFKDINNHWAKASIIQAVNDGYIKGYEDGTFRPNGVVTRAEFATIISRASKNAETNTASFTDINPSAWSYAPIMSAVGKGFIDVNRYGSKINPNSVMTRAEVAQWLANGLVASNPEFATAMTDMQNTLVPVKEWNGGLGSSKQAIALLVGTGIMNGDNTGAFGPNKSVTRAEMVSLLYRYAKVEGTNPDSYLGLKEMREVGLTGTNMVSLAGAEVSAGFGGIKGKDLSYSNGVLTPQYYIMVDTFNSSPKSLYSSMFKINTGVSRDYRTFILGDFVSTQKLSGNASYSSSDQLLTGGTFEGLGPDKIYNLQSLPNGYTSVSKYKSISEFLPVGVKRSFWTVSSARKGGNAQIGGNGNLRFTLPSSR